MGPSRDAVYATDTLFAAQRSLGGIPASYPPRRSPLLPEPSRNVLGSGDLTLVVEYTRKGRRGTRQRTLADRADILAPTDPLLQLMAAGMFGPDVSNIEGQAAHISYSVRML